MYDMGLAVVQTFVWLAYLGTASNLGKLEGWVARHQPHISTAQPIILDAQHLVTATYARNGAVACLPATLSTWPSRHNGCEQH